MAGCSSNGGILLPFSSLPSPRFSAIKPPSSSSSLNPPKSQSHQDSDGSQTPPKFTYSRASPSVRWPHLHPPPSPSPPLEDDDEEEEVSEENAASTRSAQSFFSDEQPPSPSLPTVSTSRNKIKKLNKLALKRARDWRQKVRSYATAILELDPDESVADVLDRREVQLTPVDFCFLVKWLGVHSWHRALEVYEWLNLRRWYSPNPRMLATILAVLGKANQVSLAREFFTRAISDPSAGQTHSDTVQVYNAMMGVYARSGDFYNVHQLFDGMRQKGCQPDLVSFNTLINARLKAGPFTANLPVQLLDEVSASGLRPDAITYNTIITACSRHSKLEEAVKVFHLMESRGCQPDLWTYNAMISVYARCGLASKAYQLFKQLEGKGFSPDAVTYNSLVYAFAREGNEQKVNLICEEMLRMGFHMDEMTYNTIIHMYGKLGQHDLALRTYTELKSAGRNPDAVTYTVLIDVLGKASKIEEAAAIMSEMLVAQVKPTVATYSALICGYAKVGNQTKAEETYNCMLRSGIKPDLLAYSVMLDILLRSDGTNKAMMLYREMVCDGIAPDRTLYQTLLRVLHKENRAEDIERVVRDMEQLCGLNLQTISSILVKGDCYEEASKMLRRAIISGSEVDQDDLLSILGSYSSSNRLPEALSLLELLKEYAFKSKQLISEASIVVFCKAKQQEAALKEYTNLQEFGRLSGSSVVFECLIECCQGNNQFAEASQIFSDMRANYCTISDSTFESMVLLYCKMDFPETAQHLIDLAEIKGVLLHKSSIYVEIIKAYGKSKLWHKAESLVGNLRQRSAIVDRKIWNSLIDAYAESGCYERARAVFNTMMKDGPSPTVDSINGLLQALIVDGRLDELYVVIEELQDMGFKISKSSILLMIDAFARSGNVFEVKKIYQGMKAAGYFPSMHLYRVMIALLCQGKKVRDAEVMVSEMKEAGFEPDLPIWNSMLKLYVGNNDFRNAVHIFQQIKNNGFIPDEDTYNTLVVMYCRDCRPAEGSLLVNEMVRLGLEPRLGTYKSLLTAFGRLQLVSQAEELFAELVEKGKKLDRFCYHTMMKIFRNSGNHGKAESLLKVMKDAGMEPTTETMHLLMVTYGASGHPKEADEVLNNLKHAGLDLSTLPYASVIEAYFKEGEYNAGIQKLEKMKREGVEADHRIWTCFIRGASLAQHSNEAINLLSALGDAGFDLPMRLLTKSSDSLVVEVDDCLEMLGTMADNAALNFVNALEDLLWAYEQRATASWVFQLAIKRRIYPQHVLRGRVADSDWGADFRKLSGGAALVGLTLWLDHMQASYLSRCSQMALGDPSENLDASLHGYPVSPKMVVLITGTAEYNMVSLSSTVKAYLWEMGSPFFPCRTRTGVLMAKAHSLKMWLKDSPFCLDLELKNSPELPDSNSMCVFEGCFMRRELVPAFKEITEKLGVKVRPKKFAQLAMLSPEKRESAIKADIEGRKEKLEKMMKRKLAIDVKKQKINRRRAIYRSELAASRAGNGDIARDLHDT
ncbi:Pentatricopeptide repeat-containing protein At3g18110, chloroplastic [Linum grandiflorum]